MRLNFSQNLDQIKPVIILLISGICMGVTTAPWQLWPLAWISLAPLWVIVVQSLAKLPDNSPTKFNLYLLILPSAWGIGFYSLTISWIWGIHPMTWLGVPWLASLAIALFCWIFLTLWGTALVVIWAILWQIIKPNNLLTRVIFGTALWCGLELAWSHSILWWPSLSLTQSYHNLVILHLSQIAGPNTVNAAIVLVNALLAEAWLALKSDRSGCKLSLGLKIFLMAIVSGVTLHLGGAYLYNIPLNDDPKTALKIGIIQGNIPNQIKFQSDGWRRALEGYTAGYQILADRSVDAVIIPETALPFIWTPETQSNLSFYQAILAKKVVAWVGTFGKTETGLTNSLFTVNGNGENMSRYDKVKLVPLGEYIPLENIVGKIINKLSPLDARLVPGKPNQIFPTPFGQAIVGICYDSAFTDLFRSQTLAGGLFIITVANNAHYLSSMALQHHAQDVIRAIESDRWMIRATNTGYSGIVNPHGQTIWRSEFNQYQLYNTTIYRRQTKTLYVQWGDWLTPVLLGLSLITLLTSKSHIIFKQAQF